MGNDGTAAEKLSAQQQKLETQLAAAGKRTQLYADELDKMRAAGNTTGAEYTKLVGKLADSQRVESSLQNQLNKVNAEIKEQGSEASQAKSKLSELQSEGATLDQKQQELASSAKLENAQLKANGTESEQLAAKQRQLKSALDLGKQSISNLEQQLKETKTAYGENSTEASQMSIKLNNAKTSVVNLEGQLSNLGKSTATANDKLDEIAKNTAADRLQAMSDGLQSAGEKVSEFNEKAQDAWAETDDAVDNLTSKTGATGKAAEELSESYEKVERSTSGAQMESDDLSNTMAGLKSQFDLEGKALEGATEYVAKFSAITGQTGTDAVNALHTSMSKFNVSASQMPSVLDALAKGAQTSGMDVGDLESAVGDAYPVFSQLHIGLNQGIGIISSWAKGGIDATTALKGMSKASTVYAADNVSLEKGITKTFTAIKNAKSPTDALNAGVTAFGAKAAPKMVAAIQSGKVSLDSLKTAASDSGGTVAKSFEQTLDPVDKAKVAQKEFDQTMAKVGGTIQETLLPVIKSLLPIVKGIAQAFQAAPAPVKALVVIVGGLTVALGALAPIITALATALPLFGAGEAAAGAGAATAATGVGALMTTLLPVVLVVAGVAAAITALVLVIKNWGAITTWLKGIWQNLVTFFNTAKTKLATVFNSFGPLLTTFKQFFSNTFSNIKLLITGLKTTISGVLNVIVGLFTGNGAKIKKGFQQVFQGLVDIGASMLRQLINSVTSGLTGIVNAFSGIFGKARGIVSSIWSAIRGFFSSNLSSILGTVRSIFGTLVGAITHPLQTAKSAIGGIISGIKSLFNFHISWPRIPLPHFSLSGAFNPLKGQIPHVAVDWYAQGGIMTQPTLMGFNNGRAQVGGEAGAEGVIPLNNDTWNKMGAAIAAHMPTGGPIVLQVDGRTFATITGPYTSDYLKQQDATQNFSYGRRN
jgi:phage-related minor tail protein